jgi:uncharacterized protein (UPF0210 family)
MKIRAITIFADLGPPLNEAQIEQLGEFARAARQAFEGDGWVVQTTRLASNAFSHLRLADGVGQWVDFTVALERTCQLQGFEYISLGPAGRETWEQLPELLAAAGSVFASVNLTNCTTGAIDGAAIRGAAQVIRGAMTSEADGFANLRFAALANVGPGTPFFPAAYHDGGPPAFAIATEAADLALEVCAGARDAEVVRWRLVAAIEKQARRLAQRAEKLAQEHDIRFGGIDFSLAPFPSPETSIGAALESLSGGPLGGMGSLAAAAVLTDAIERAQFPRCGFCGLMLPLLEDTVLAARAAEGRLRVGDLLQWSAVCGTGLDTVPLPGDVSEGALTALLLDVAALAVRSGKPLSARLMPLPGKIAGDPVNFDFSYFTDSRVLSLDGKQRPNLLTCTAELHLMSHSRNLLHPEEI